MRADARLPRPRRERGTRGMKGARERTKKKREKRDPAQARKYSAPSSHTYVARLAERAGVYTHTHRG